MWKKLSNWWKSRSNYSIPVDNYNTYGLYSFRFYPNTGMLEAQTNAYSFGSNDLKELKLILKGLETEVLMTAKSVGLR